MEIIEIARSYIKISVEGRTAKIEGEGFSREFSKVAPDYVDFIVYPNSLTHWSKPWEGESMPSELRDKIIDFIKEDFSRRGQLLAVE
jgi:hypothetical protein